MNNKQFDPNKPVQTRDGRKARIICTDSKTNQKIVALITTIYDEEYISFHTDTGKYYNNDAYCSNNDLINIPEKHTIERWLVIFNDTKLVSIWDYHPTEHNIQVYKITAIKKLTIEYVEGEGLD